jgi:hypothetical protein
MPEGGLENLSFDIRLKYFIAQKTNIRVRVIVFNATFNNISVISWRSVLLVGET